MGEKDSGLLVQARHSCSAINLQCDFSQVTPLPKVWLLIKLGVLIFFPPLYHTVHQLTTKVSTNNLVILCFKSQPEQRHYFANKGLSSQSYSFSSTQVWMWELDYKESWAPKNWCFWTVGLEKTPESPLYCKEIQPVHPKGDQSWIFIGRTDVEVKTTILWPPDAKNWLIWKDPVVGKDWRWEEKGTTEDEMVWWHHQLNGHESG